MAKKTKTSFRKTFMALMAVGTSFSNSCAIVAFCSRRHPRNGYLFAGERLELKLYVIHIAIIRISK